MKLFEIKNNTKIIKKMMLTFLVIFSFFYNCARAEELNIVYVTDNNYVLYTLISIKSMLDNNVSNSDYKFFILENGISEESKKEFKNLISKYKQNIEFISCDTTPIDSGKHLQKGLVSDEEIYIPRIVTAKLLIPTLLSDDIDKALYLDGDTLILSDVKELYNENIENYIASMGIDNGDYADREINNYPVTQPCYFNAGVILFNLSKWREMNITEQMEEFTKQNPKLFYAEQDILNSVINYEDIKMFEIKWNNQFRPDLKTLMDENSKNEGIRHYFTKIKPWNFSPQNCIYKREYLKFWWRSQYRYKIITHIPNSIFKFYNEFIGKEKQHIKTKIKEYKEEKETR